MSKSPKRMIRCYSQVDCKRKYRLEEALDLLKALPKVGFKETVEYCCHLGVDVRKSDQSVRGAVVLPHGTGKVKRVAVCADGEQASVASQAGADLVGFEDLAQSVREGHIAFDVLIATPAAMKIVGKLGPILGPRGLMPNPKTGTVTDDVAAAVRDAKAGRIQFRADKGALIHAGVGLCDFDTAQLAENIRVLTQELKRVKPATAKGIYFREMFLSSTMGPGIKLDVASVVG